MTTNRCLYEEYIYKLLSMDNLIDDQDDQDDQEVQKDLEKHNTSNIFLNSTILLCVMNKMIDDNKIILSDKTRKIEELFKKYYSSYCDNTFYIYLNKQNIDTFNITQYINEKYNREKYERIVIRLDMDKYQEDKIILLLTDISWYIQSLYSDTFCNIKEFIFQTQCPMIKYYPNILNVLAQFGFTTIEVDIEPEYKYPDYIYISELIRSHGYKFNILYTIESPLSFHNKDIDIIDKLFYSKYFTCDEVILNVHNISEDTLIIQWLDSTSFEPYNDNITQLPVFNSLKYGLKCCPEWMSLSFYNNDSSIMLIIKQIMTHELELLYVLPREIQTRLKNSHHNITHLDNINIKEYKIDHNKKEYFISIGEKSDNSLTSFVRMTTDYNYAKVRELYLNHDVPVHIHELLLNTVESIARNKCYGITINHPFVNDLLLKKYDYINNVYSKEFIFIDIYRFIPYLFFSSSVALWFCF